MLFGRERLKELELGKLEEEARQGAGTVEGTEEMEKRQESEKIEHVRAAIETLTEDTSHMSSAPLSPARPSSLPCVNPNSQPSLPSPHPLPATQGSPAQLPSPGSSPRYLSLPLLLSPTPAIPKALKAEQEVEEPQPSSKPRTQGTFLEELALKLQRKEQQEVASREDREHQELVSREDREPQELVSREDREQQELASREDREQQELASREDREQQELAIREDREQQELASREDREQQELVSMEDREQQELASREDREQQELASREDREQQDLAERAGKELQDGSDTDQEVRKEEEALEKKDASGYILEADESARILSLLEPARRKGGKDRKPKPKKFFDNFLSESEGDKDDPPYLPVAVRKKTPVKARKKRDMFNKVIVCESEEVVDDPKAELKTDKDIINGVITKTIKKAKQLTQTKRERGRPKKTPDVKKIPEDKKIKVGRKNLKPSMFSPAGAESLPTPPSPSYSLPSPSLPYSSLPSPSLPSAGRRVRLVSSAKSAPTRLSTNLVPCVSPPGVHLHAPGVKGVAMSLSRPLAASTPSHLPSAGPSYHPPAGNTPSRTEGEQEKVMV